MKPAKFNYIRPSTLDEVKQYLHEYGESAKLMSGGQSLIPVLNMRLSTPKYLIDLGGIKELNYIREQNNKICIGALSRHVEVERSELIKEKCPLLHEAMKYIGHPQIRNRGTVGGSIAHADPSAELPCVLSALRGEIVIEDEFGETVLQPEEFFLTYLLTSLEPTQMVKEVRFPIISKTSGVAFVEKARRHGDFALIAIAAVLDFDDEGFISSANIAIGGANPVPCILEEVEEKLIGKKPSDNLFHKTGESVKDYLDPEGDSHGSAEYRKHLASVLTTRALKEASYKVGKGVRS